MERAKCIVCRKNVVTSQGRDKNGKTIYKKKCFSCSTSDARKKTKKYKRFPWTKFKKDKCEFCGFIPVNMCQIDVDHIDGDKTNNDERNLQTLCANCHRLKTFLSEDWRKK